MLIESIMFLALRFRIRKTKHASGVIYIVLTPSDLQFRTERIYLTLWIVVVVNPFVKFCCICRGGPRSKAISEVSTKLN